MASSTDSPPGGSRERKPIDHTPRGREARRPARNGMDPSSISVVVPTYNDVGRLGDALSSIVNQTLSPGEIIVADDGSSDGTDAFVRDFADRHAGELAIGYLRLTTRSGVVAARNEGIATARGEWIATCDSDDVWAPTKLERQWRFLEEWKGSQRIALLGTYGYNMNDAKRIISPAAIGPASEREYESVQATGGGFYLIHSSVLYRRSDFLAVGGYTTEYGAADDLHFYCLLADRGVVIAVCEPLVYYRKRAGSVQLASFWDKEQNAQRLFENRRRRAGGQPPIGREEFIAQLASSPLRDRLRRRRRTSGSYFYRLGATSFVNGERLRGAAQLLLAGVLDFARVRAAVLNLIRGRLRGDVRARMAGPR